jgi:phenylpyruvate tautomerase PptA (4-oxalocrotonate tautomerase family)
LEDDFGITFNPLWQMTDEQKAQVASHITETATRAYGEGVVTQQVALKELKRQSEVTGIFTSISEEDIEAASSELAPAAGEEEGEEQTPELGPDGEPVPPSSNGTPPIPPAGDPHNPDDTALDEKKQRSTTRDRRKKMHDSAQTASELSRRYNLQVIIEYPRTSSRYGVVLPADYGYIRMTDGADGDQVDCFVGENHSSDDAYVIDLLNDDGSFDEHKVMFGYDDEASAVHDFLYVYGPDRLGKVQHKTIEELQKWLVPRA